jgi:histidine triad (HIT) family protein
MSIPVTTCTFCAIVAARHDAEIVYRDGDVVAFLDHRPLFPGHTLVVPVRHVETLGDLPDDLVVPLMRIVRAASRAMESGLAAQGSFVAENNRVSQSVPHLHFHVVPRTKGDGLRGFFWPRSKYAGADEIAQVGALVREAIHRELDMPETGAAAE